MSRQHFVGELRRLWREVRFSLKSDSPQASNPHPRKRRYRHDWKIALLASLFRYARQRTAAIVDAAAEAATKAAVAALERRVTELRLLTPLLALSSNPFKIPLPQDRGNHRHPFWLDAACATHAHPLSRRR